MFLLLVFADSRPLQSDADDDDADSLSASHRKQNARTSELEPLEELTYDFRTVVTEDDGEAEDLPDANAAFGGTDPWKAIQQQSASVKAKNYDPKVAGSYADGEYLEEYTVSACCSTPNRAPYLIL